MITSKWTKKALWISSDIFPLSGFICPVNASEEGNRKFGQRPKWGHSKFHNQDAAFCLILSPGCDVVLLSPSKHFHNLEKTSAEDLGNPSSPWLLAGALRVSLPLLLAAQGLSVCTGHVFQMDRTCWEVNMPGLGNLKCVFDQWTPGLGHWWKFPSPLDLSTQTYLCYDDNL